MRLAHKRNVQMKLQKRIKATATMKPAVKAVKAVKESPVKEVAKSTASAVTVSLTPKQQQVLDIVSSKPEGINSKGIGLEAGQEDGKASSWATGALKKLLDENLVAKEQLAGNKVIYKIV